ncbi:hypothetical protein HNQ88_004148 [Aureibacter tunicatorum]|uniref:Uncharacterized protein n=1 Tax=Aureibacter tunicatorum TaxID=866807 RepID=A0AAE3XR43_9BACT|nr:hypothetical protein [Aureibacter tunicatorum]BDD03850.1 hypothetical protein AUTU_13330 [Aureibacter tunicatorum]
MCGLCVFIFEINDILIAFCGVIFFGIVIFDYELRDNF